MWQENEIYTELVEAFKLFNIVNPISQKGEEIFNAVQNHYVTGNPRVWWLSFKTAPKSYYFEDNDGFHHIKDILIKYLYILSLCLLQVLQTQRLVLKKN